MMFTGIFERVYRTCKKIDPISAMEKLSFNSLVLSCVLIIIVSRIFGMKRL